MNCEDFEQLLADAWGDELARDQRNEFDDHVTECPSCRVKFEQGLHAIKAMRSLEGPRPVQIVRDGDRLVIQHPETPVMQPRRAAPTGLLRLVASIVIAFTAGYALHAGLMMRDAARSSIDMRRTDPGQPIVDTSQGEHSNGPAAGERESSSAPRERTLRAALASTYLRGGRRSDVATCMMALSAPGT